MSMSHARIRACGASAPIPSLSACASALITKRATMQRLRVHIFDRTVGADLPALNTIEEIVGLETTCRDQRLSGWLHITRLVHCATLQNRGRAIPSPRCSKGREALRQYRFLQLCFLPGATCVD